MTIEMVDGVQVIKLKDKPQPGAVAQQAEMPVMMHLWMLLTGAHSLRDTSVGPRRFIRGAYL